MSSASKLALAVMVLFAVACNRPGSGDEGSMREPPAGPMPVGPTPGPHVDAGEATNPFAGDPVSLHQGRVYFDRYNCSGCHGGHAGGGMGPSLRDTAWIYGSSDAQIFASIAQGRAHGMPTWGTKLPEDVVWKLVLYIKSLRTPDEPEPPDQSTPPPPEVP